jgi:hypothetical protein
MDFVFLFSDSPFPGLLGTKSARAFRATSKKMKLLVSTHPWDDRKTTITSCHNDATIRWRRCFPFATFIKLECPYYVFSFHIKGMQGVSEVDISGSDLSGGALENLHHLNKATWIDVRSSNITKEAIAMLSSEEEKTLIVCEDQGKMIADLTGFRVIIGPSIKRPCKMGYKATSRSFKAWSNHYSSDYDVKRRYNSGVILIQDTSVSRSDWSNVTTAELSELLTSYPNFKDPSDWESFEAALDNLLLPVVQRIRQSDEGPTARPRFEEYEPPMR